MPKIKMLRNLGTNFYQKYGMPKLPDNKMHVVNETYDVSDDFAKILLTRGLGEPAGTVHAVPQSAAIRGVPAEHVSQTDEAEAIKQIDKLKNKDALQHVADHDSRPAVKEAAKKRIAAL